MGRKNQPEQENVDVRNEKGLPHIPSDSESTVAQEDAKSLAVHEPSNGHTESGAPDKPKETKSARFTRLVDKRMPKALKALNAVANLGNANQYEYTERDRDDILNALIEAMSGIKAAFSPKQTATTAWR